MPKILLDHTRLDTSNYLVRVKEISVAVAAAPALSALGPKLAPFDQLVVTLDEKNTAYNNTLQTCTTALTERESAREDVEAGLRSLANASEGETADTAELQAGGWHVRGTRGPVGPMTAPQNVTTTGGDQDGQADSTFDPVDGRQTYLGEHATTPAGPWTQFYVGKKSGCTAGGLVSGQVYYFRFRAVGAAGPGPWSDPSAKRAT